MKRLLLAFQFLTIIPIRNNITVKETDIAKSSSLFVIVGLVQGVLLIATYYGAKRIFHSDLVTIITLLVLVLSNGGFHLDGLADTFDAIAVKSKGDIDTDRKKRLSVMKDSATGPIGVIAVVFTLLLKFLALNNLYQLSIINYQLSVFLMPMLPKWSMVISMFYGKPAREDGLGRIFVNRVGFKEISISTLILLLILALLQIFFGRYIQDNQFIFYAILLLTMYFICRVCINFFNKKFGGLTGDTLGAISEITEIIFLLMVIVWSQLFI